MSERVDLKADDRWVSVSVREIGPIGYHRHIVRKGGLTTVCGATASSPDVWRGNSSKPRWGKCVQRYADKKEGTGSVSRKRAAKKKPATPRSPKDTTVVPKTVTKQELLDLTELLDQITFTLIDEFEVAGIVLAKTIGTTRVTVEWDPNEREWTLEFK